MKKKPSTSFEDQWRDRFESFANSNEDDAGIAGWSTTGLETRFRHFTHHWPGDENGRLWVDVGCGAGTYSQFLAQHNLRVLGFDYSLPTLKKAKSRNIPSVNWIAGNVKSFPLTDQFIDGVLCFGVIQALENSEDAIRELLRITRPGGQIWVDGLNIWCIPHIAEIIRRKLQNKPTHTRYESPWKMQAIFKSAGAQQVRIIWLPVLPKKLQRFQWSLETRLARGILHFIPFIGALFSHSFVIQVQK